MNNSQKILFLLIILVFNITHLESADFDYLTNEFEDNYIITLKNGDVLSGKIVDAVYDDKYGEGIKVSTEIGTATIFLVQIKHAERKNDYYRHSNRIYIMPTAIPIKNNHYLANYQLVLFNAGVGIMDIFSITAGRSIIPFLPSEQQLSTLNMKATVHREDFVDFDGEMHLAVGGNLAFMNHNNRFIHSYFAATFRKGRSIFNALLYYKNGSRNFYDIQVQDEFFGFDYENGAVGIGLGLDTKFSNTHNLHFIGEMWNANLVKPQNTAVLLGIRLANEKFSADFGLMFVTEPFAAPFFSFVWTPF